jgi:hypothetical protein
VYKDGRINGGIRKEAIRGANEKSSKFSLIKRLLS